MEQKKILCSNENKNITKHISVAAKYNITLNFSILVISCCMHGQKDRNFQKKSCSIPYHILTLVEPTGTVHESIML